MSDERTKLEVIAPSVEEALEKGLHDLGLSAEDVDVEVLDEGKKGLLGIGSRQARIAIKIKPQEKDIPQESGVQLIKQPTALPKQKQQQETSAEESEEISIARETINIILEKMHVNADVSVKLGDSASGHIQPIIIDIEGDDLSFLIGRKAETINSLQYITSLIVGRALGRWIPLQIDVQHYRKRREDELRKLAKRIADQVIRTGRRQVLEPMQPNERRIIHIELRENQNVETESIGEDPRRKVTVRPRD